MLLLFFCAIFQKNTQVPSIIYCIFFISVI